jgi:hypothetical protein
MVPHGVSSARLDKLDAAVEADGQFNMLLGHTKATTTGTYGIVPQGILSQRVGMIEAVHF